MPLHDWSSQTDELFHDFRGRWTTYLTDALNGGVLPGEFVARSESGLTIAGLDEPEEESVHRVPDIDVIRDPLDDHPGSAVAVAAAPPVAATTLELTEQLQRLRRVAIRRGEGDLVAMIEIVPRANFATARARANLADKCLRLISANVHVVVLDLHPRRGRLAPIEELIARDFGFEETNVREEGQALLTSVVAGQSPTAYFNPISPGEPLPAAPLFVSEERYVPLPLKETYTETFDRFPRQVKVRFAA